jgi:hypothetical protein
MEEKKLEGEWVPVTNSSQLSIGDRVRYRMKRGDSWCGSDMTGIYGDELGRRTVSNIINGIVIVSYDNARTADFDLFGGTLLWRQIEKWVPKTQKTTKPPTIDCKQKKTLEIEVYNARHTQWCWRCEKICGISCYTVSRLYYSRSTAIRGAKRFCKALGFECKIIN